ncbi:MAG: FliG C-terminal domain-containing protein, partial [Planctomycetota bacterium]
MEKLTGVQKVAIILSTLDADAAAGIIKELDDEKIALVTAEMSKFDRIDKELVDRVLDDLSQELHSTDSVNKYDNTSFKKLLEKAVGAQKTEEIFTSVEDGTLYPIPFQILKEASDDEIVRLIVGEHPQTIALILSYIDPPRAAKALSQFPTELQAEIIMRISTMDPPPARLLMQVNTVIASKIKNEDKRQKMPAKKKYKLATDIISSMEGAADKSVVDMINHRNPELADEIKKLLFTFDDVVSVQDEALRKILTEVDNRVIALAMKTANEEIE